MTTIPFTTFFGSQLFGANIKWSVRTTTTTPTAAAPTLDLSIVVNTKANPMII